MRTSLVFAACLFALPAFAQDAPPADPPPSSARQPWRTRVTLGPQLAPRYPGSDRVALRPFVEVDRARGDAPFAYTAQDDSFGFAVAGDKSFAFGPALAFQSRRSARDVGAALPHVGLTVEAGGFVNVQLAGPLRARVEVRQGIGGHKGMIANGGIDYVARQGDDWLFSIGPRVTVTSARYQRAYFGVDAAAAAASGLPQFKADGGVQAAGVMAGYLHQLSPRWGINSFVRYDRLVGDAARSPVTTQLGSRNQFWGAVALSYTFGGR